jgi:hypothetical protein
MGGRGRGTAREKKGENKMLAEIELTVDIKRAIPCRGFNNSWPSGTRFFVRQRQPDWGMVVIGPHPDAGLGVSPHCAKVLRTFDSYSEVRKEWQ